MQLAGLGGSSCRLAKAFAEQNRPVSANREEGNSPDLWPRPVLGLRSGNVAF